MTPTLKKQLGDAILEAAFANEFSGLTMDLETYVDHGTLFTTVELYPEPDNEKVFDRLSALCRQIQETTGIPAPSDSRCDSLWLEVNHLTGEISSETHLKSGTWYTSSPFENIHDNFENDLTEEIINTIRQTFQDIK